MLTAHQLLLMRSRIKNERFISHFSTAHKAVSIFFPDLAAEYSVDLHQVGMSVAFAPATFGKYEQKDGPWPRFRHERYTAMALGFDLPRVLKSAAEDAFYRQLEDAEVLIKLRIKRAQGLDERQRLQEHAVRLNKLRKKFIDSILTEKPISSSDLNEV